MFGFHASFEELGIKRDLNKNHSKPKIALRENLASFVRWAKGRNRASNPIAANQADIVNWALYDRIVLAAGATPAATYNMFTQPIGQNGKTKADTNLEQVSRLPDPLWMNVIGVGFGFAPNNVLADVQNFLAAYYMEFWVSQKVYLEGPLQVYPSGNGITGATVQSGSAFISNGTPNVNNYFDVRLPAGIHLGSDSAGNPITTDGLTGITILQGQTFKVAVIAPGTITALSASNATPTPGTGLTMNTYLYGILSRGVQ